MIVRLIPVFLFSTHLLPIANFYFIYLKLCFFITITIFTRYFLLLLHQFIVIVTFSVFNFSISTALFYSATPGLFINVFNFSYSPIVTHFITILFFTSIF